MNTFNLHRGHLPLLISLPHDGTTVPDSLLARLTDSACHVPDTDWFVSRLYAFMKDIGASVLVPHYSRYVIDLNRSPDDLSLYPGQNTTGLCPTVQFSGEPVYREGQVPSLEEVKERVQTYWLPYHQALATELERLRGLYGRVVLWEGHSILSELPFLFDGRLPEFNIGTSNGASCSSSTQLQIESVLAAQTEFSWVVNGRFKGGYITRHYGRPDCGIEAIQLELAQCTYMDESRVLYNERKAAQVQKLIYALIQSVLRMPD